MALPPWRERTADLSGPRPFDIHDFTEDVLIGGNSATVPQTKIYDTPGNTPMNRAKGNLYELPGRYVWTSEPLDSSEKY